MMSTELVHDCRFFLTNTAFSGAFCRFLLGIELASAEPCKEVPRSVILLGTGISSAFVEVILVVNAIILSLVLLAAYFDEIAGICARAFHQLAGMLALLIAHLGPRHR
ncbi:MAG TPA: hypothetical protein VKF40_01255 [Burkholderiales bacterium]|nr:hypothetical protein [Burkholderiales bacterium]